MILKSSSKPAEQPQLFSHSLIIAFVSNLKHRFVRHYNGLFPLHNHGTSHKKSVSFIDLKEAKHTHYFIRNLEFGLVLKVS